MKTLAWHQFFAEQRERHGKVIFTVGELANVAGTSLHSLNTELNRLVQRGVITRYAQGRYGPPNDVLPETIIASLDSSAYITGHYALFLNQLVTQPPAEIVCFTRRRHNRQKMRDTPAGRLQFLHVPSRVYHKPDGAISGEQALFDFSWLMLRKGLEPESLVTFRNLHKLNLNKLKHHMKRYPKQVAEKVMKLTQGRLEHPHA